MRGTTIEHLSVISSGPVKTFWYCEDCKAITSQPKCAYCASDSVHPLERLINRQSQSYINSSKLPEALHKYIDNLDSKTEVKEFDHVIELPQIITDMNGDVA